MREIDDCIKARSFVTSLKVLNDKNIAFATKLHGVKICTPDECSVNLNFANQHLNSSTTAICFNNDGTMLAFANEKIIYIVDLVSKDIIKTINTDNENIQLLIFDDTSKHIIAGSSNGRVLHYRTEGLSLLCRLCSFPYDRADSINMRQNYVSAFVFRGNILATAGYGGTIHIIDIHSSSTCELLFEIRLLNEHPANRRIAGINKSFFIELVFHQILFLLQHLILYQLFELRIFAIKLGHYVEKF